MKCNALLVAAFLFGTSASTHFLASEAGPTAGAGISATTSLVDSKEKEPAQLAQALYELFTGESLSADGARLTLRERWGGQDLYTKHDRDELQKRQKTQGPEEEEVRIELGKDIAKISLPEDCPVGNHKIRTHPLITFKPTPRHLGKGGHRSRIARLKCGFTTAGELSNPLTLQASLVVYGSGKRSVKYVGIDKEGKEHPKYYFEVVLDENNRPESPVDKNWERTGFAFY